MTARAPETARLRALVRERAGLEVTGARGDLFDAALARAAREAGEEPEGHAARVVSGELPLQRFLEELAVHETWFFRDAAQWELVERELLPAAERRGRLRAWSAACSSGEEPYSLAILAKEAGLEERTTILASDLSEAALARARRASYSLWSLRGSAAGRARRWLHEEGNRLVLDPAIVRLVRFFPLNLVEEGYPSPSRGLADLDLVLCRNVLIYLDRATLPGVARRLLATLAPGGVLLTGGSDPALDAFAPFEPAGVHGAWRRAQERRAAPPVAQVARAVASSRRRVERAVRPAEPDERRGRAPATSAVGGVEAEECLGCRALIDAGRHAEALVAIESAVRAAPLRPELHVMHALVLAELGRLAAAEEACRRAQYLARGEPFVPFFLGLVRLQRRDAAGAASALVRALSLAERSDPAERVAFSEGLTAGELAGAARHHLSQLRGEAPPARGDGSPAPGP